MFIRMIIIVSICLLWGGCTDLTDIQLLYADFESDTDGALPDFDLPGEPVGDKLDWNGAVSGSILPVSIITKERTIDDETVSTHWLRVASVSSNPGDRLILLPNRSGDTGNVFTIQWEGDFVAMPAPSPTLNFAVKTNTSFSAHPIISFKFVPRGGATSDFKIDVHLTDANGEAGEKIGELQNQTFHRFTITVNLEASTYTIIGGNLGSVNSGLQNFTPDTSPRAPLLQLSFANLGMGATFYSFEDVRIDQIR